MPVSAKVRTVVVGAILLAAACSGGAEQGTVTGIVVDLNGDITSVSTFVLRLPDGSDRTITPAPGVRFHDDAAIGHLRDHLRNGTPIRVEYEVLDDGSWVARSVEDAGAG